MIKSFHIEFAKAQLMVVSNLSELNKTRSLHHYITSVLLVSQ